MRKTWKTFGIVAFAMILLLGPGAPPSFAGDDHKEKEEAEHGKQEKSVGNQFIDAYFNKQEDKMKQLIATRTEEFPPEVRDMVAYAISDKATKKDQDFLFTVAFAIAKMYRDHTGDGRLYAAVEMNYKKIADSRKSEPAISQASIDKTKAELAAMGEGAWNVAVFEMEENGELNVEIDVRDDAGKDGMSPKVEFAKGEKAKELVKKNLPDVKKGKISWRSMGVGLKTVFIE